MRISEILSGVSVDRVREVVEKMVVGNHFVHGVKHQSSWRQVSDEGVKPLSPEIGHVSYWTTGLRAFTSTRSHASNEYGYDSSIFHYGCQFLVITNLQILSALGIGVDFRANGLAVVSSLVPRNSVAILDVSRSNDHSGKMMFELLEKVLQKRYRGGEYIRG